MKIAREIRKNFLANNFVFVLSFSHLLQFAFFVVGLFFNSGIASKGAVPNFFFIIIESAVSPRVREVIVDNMLTNNIRLSGRSAIELFMHV